MIEVLLGEEPDPWERARCLCITGRIPDPDVDRLDLLVAVGWPLPLACLAIWDRDEFFRRWNDNPPR